MHMKRLTGPDNPTTFIFAAQEHKSLVTLLEQKLREVYMAIMDISACVMNQARLWL